MQVLNQRHSMLKRQALLLKAGADALQEEDKARLEVCRSLTLMRQWPFQLFMLWCITCYQQSVCSHKITGILPI